VAADFHARFSATSRSYRYRLVDAAIADPIRRNDRWQVGAKLAVPPMRRAARLLTGEHDFASFCRRAQGGTTTRRLDEVVVSRPAAGRIDVRLTGTAFCHQQVRSILGCLVEVGRGHRDADWVGQVLAARDRAAATAKVAPPHGLTLERVSYGRRWPAAPPPAVR
jgi:tRNA pseudouridine38-40 synthase